MKNHLLFLFISCFLFSCGVKEPLQSNLLEQALASKHPKIKRVVDSLSRYEVQIKYTRIDRKGEQLVLEDFDFQVDSTRYFYPASTVKFPIALLALSKLNGLKGINRNTKFYVEGDSLTTTFAKEIQKIFAVSDNEAYNRLFEFLGQDHINTELHRIALGPVRISHRLSTPEADEITTKPLIAYLNDSTTTTLPGSINTTAKALVLKHIEKGSGYRSEDSLLREPFDFSLKNYYPIETQHRLLKTVMFPELYKQDEKIDLTREQLDFVRTAMRTVPKNTGYDADTYYDGYCKFFMYGDTRENIPEHINIYNKVGDAYGTLTDTAYIQDTKNGVEFLLTATILVNKNGIFNDDTYEYDDIGFPFLAQLGRELYRLELERKSN
ncbi:serine hydrolase [Aggregatimonas sangjinii]|uniref:Serine hydrolase n=1 Tax=Aggregatimonas sangjinii TaxID=2583587 RepID=A0A5B7SUV4_9FLAO|nr:serine hydrolase [Aggregatimonas sangjinii]QCX00701.1 serine hydrolase [Aggregatimonas sangjinii]